MKSISMVGIDLAKSIFHIHAIDDKGRKLFNRRLSRRKFFSEIILQATPQTIIAMEACSTAHYWGRRFKEKGYTVKLINPAFVKPFVKSNKNDYNDAEAICIAASQPTMRFVPVKTQEQQEMRSIHSLRESVVRQRTQIANQLRSLLAEFGYVTKGGTPALRKLVTEVITSESTEFGVLFKECLQQQFEQLCLLEKKKKEFDNHLFNFAKDNEACTRLMKIPGIGPVCSTALYATVSQGYDFKNGREMSAWLGLVPKQDTTGGKPKLLGISKRGDRYLRKQLIHGARAVYLHRKRLGGKIGKWANNLSEKKHYNAAIVAIANKNARIVWALLKHGTEYKADHEMLIAA